MNKEERRAVKIVAGGVCHHTNHLRQMLVSYNDKLRIALSDGDMIEAGRCSDRIVKATFDMNMVFNKLQALANDGADELITIKDTTILDIDATIPI